MSASDDPACEPWEAWRRGLKRSSRPMAPVRWYGGKGNLLGFIRPLLAGIEADAYEQGLSGWRKVERRTVCHAAGRVRGSGLKGNGAAKAKMPRTEVLWLNPVASAACEAVPGLL